MVNLFPFGSKAIRKPEPPRAPNQVPTGVVLTVTGVLQHEYVGGVNRTYRAMAYSYEPWRLYTSNAGTGLEAVIEAPETLPLTPGRRYRLVLEELDG